MNTFPIIERFLKDSFTYTEFNTFMRFVQQIDKGERAHPLNIYGERKCGKTVLARLLENMFKDNAVFVDSYRILSSFNDNWADKKLVIIDEIVIEDLVLDKILNIYTKDYIHVETKLKEPREIFNKVSFLLLSNLPVKKNFINHIHMRRPIPYEKMKYELTAFREFVKNYQP